MDCNYHKQLQASSCYLSIHCTWAFVFVCLFNHLPVTWSEQTERRRRTHKKDQRESNEWWNCLLGTYWLQLALDESNKLCGPWEASAGICCRIQRKGPLQNEFGKQAASEIAGRLADRHFNEEQLVAGGWWLVTGYWSLLLVAGYWQVVNGNS